jgi:hypothetical protein
MKFPSGACQRIRGSLRAVSLAERPRARVAREGRFRSCGVQPAGRVERPARRAVSRLARRCAREACLARARLRPPGGVSCGVSPAKRAGTSRPLEGCRTCDVAPVRRYLARTVSRLRSGVPPAKARLASMGSASGQLARDSPPRLRGTPPTERAGASRVRVRFRPAKAHLPRRVGRAREVRLARLTSASAFLPTKSRSRSARGLACSGPPRLRGVQPATRAGTALAGPCRSRAVPPAKAWLVRVASAMRRHGVERQVRGS